MFRCSLAPVWRCINSSAEITCFCFEQIDNSIGPYHQKISNQIFTSGHLCWHLLDFRFWENWILSCVRNTINAPTGLKWILQTISCYLLTWSHSDIIRSLCLQQQLLRFPFKRTAPLDHFKSYPEFSACLEAAYIPGQQFCNNWTVVLAKSLFTVGCAVDVYCIKKCSVLFNLLSLI